MIRILIVDDHEVVREGLKTILETEPDFEIVGESGTADRISELVEQTQPDIVLLDVRLPGRQWPRGDTAAWGLAPSCRGHYPHDLHRRHAGR